MRVSLVSAAIAAIACLTPSAMKADNFGNTLYIPERAIVVTGDSTTVGHRENIAILYSRDGMSFDEPGAPRFLFLDRQGKVALGIGGYLKGVGMYDFDGAIDAPGFATYDISVPLNPANRQRFGIDTSPSTVFLKLVANDTKLGRIILYTQIGFNSASSGYTARLRQAYVSVGHVTAGLARSTFVDGEAEAPTITYSGGPSGEVTAKNMLFRYTTGSYKGLSGAISIEVPTASYSAVADQSEKIAQRIPDIPVYVQYDWNSNSHVRLAYIHRSLSYRDMVTSKNHFATGWGVHLSSVGNIIGGFGYFGHIAYGEGIARYINDISGNGFDLVPSETAGQLRAPGTLAWTAGLSFQVTKDFLATVNGSMARVYDCGILGGDTYRYGRYVTVNGFYNLTADFRLGAELALGRRNNYDGQSGHANRLEVMMQYSF